MANRVEAHVLAAERLHGNETKVLILAKGRTGTSQMNALTTLVISGARR
jgi:hypothetical protein